LGRAYSQVIATEGRRGVGRGKMMVEFERFREKKIEKGGRVDE
jgi:hypothetical protein